MNVWYLQHYAAPPGYGAPMRPHYLAKSLSSLGHTATVVAAANHHLRTHPAAPEDCLSLRCYQGVRYYHLPVRGYAGNSISRLMNMLDFAKGIKSLESKVASGELERPDVLVASSPHLFVLPAARSLANALRAKLIFEVRDIWPLSLVHLAGVPPWHPLVLWLGIIEKQAYRQADAVVSLLPEAHLHMVNKGLDTQKFHFIPNGVDFDAYGSEDTSLPEEHQTLFEKLKSEGKKIVIYAGAHGPPNALDQVLDLARVPGNENPPYQFVLLGDGVSKQALMERVAKEKLSFVSFLSKVPKQQALKAISLADICFLGWQKKEIYQYGVSPNKLGDYLMCGKPVVHAVAAANDLVAESGAGISVEPYNAAQLDSALCQLCALSDDQRRAMGEQGRKYAIENLDWKILGKKYADLICSL